MRFLGALLIVLAGLCGTARVSAQIRGTVTDEAGATIHGAKVHVMKADTWKTVRVVQTDYNGRFEIVGLVPDRYKIAFIARSFMPETVDVDTRVPGADAGRSVRLRVLDCDGPDMNCDIFSDTPVEDPHPVVFSGRLTLRRDDVVDLDKGSIVQAEASGAALKLTETNGILYLVPFNHTVFLDNCAAVESGRARKTAATFITLTGLFENSEFCVETRRGRISKMYLTKDVNPASKEVRVYLVTRK